MKRSAVIAFVIVASCSSESSPSAVCDPGRGAMADRAPFTRFTIDDDAFGPAFVDIGDINGDGRRDLVVTSFGPTTTENGRVTLSAGRVVAYLQGDALACWHKVDIARDADSLYFPNRPTIADIDDDGDNDVIVPAGFFVCAYSKFGNCGALVWFENANHGTSWIRHDVIAPGAADDYTGVALADLDGDGVRDLVTTGEGSAGAHTLWIPGNTAANRFGNPRSIGDGGGSFPVVHDVDGDGDLDITAAEYFVPNSSFAWFEQTSPLTFARHIANSNSGKGFALDFVPNLYGDGVTRALATNHTNTSDGTAAPSSVFVLDVPRNATEPWPARPISEGIVSRPSIGQAMQGAPGVFGWGDIDGDGDIDVAVAGDGDARTFWIEQTAAGAFTTHPLETQLGQAAGARVADVDGDGKNELVFTGYEDNAVFVYARTAK